MPLYMLKHLQEESDSWKRHLAFIREENIFLKDSLSQAVKNSGVKTSLNDMENFLNQSIRLDDVHALLRHDVAVFDKLLLSEKLKDGQTGQKLEYEVKKNRINIKRYFEEFYNFKTEFNNYLRENIDEY